MSSLRSTLTLATGLAVGAVSGYCVRGLAADLHTQGAEPATGAREEDARTRIAALERDLEIERVARAHAEAARSEVSREDAARPQRTAETTAVASAASPAAPIVAAPSLAAAAEKPARADSSGRAAQLEADVARALETHDGRAALALLAELGRLGKAGWPLAARLAGEIALALDRGEPFGAYGISRREFLKASAGGDFDDLFVDAIANPQGYTPAYRRLAASRLPWTDRGGTDALLLAQLGSEADESVAEALVGGLSAMTNADRTAGLLAAYRTQTNASVRQMLLGTVEETPGDEATRALSVMVSSETDPEVKSAAELALAGRQAPVPGLFVTEVVDGSQASAAGVQLGDILTEVNGIPIHTWDDIGRGKARVPAGAPSTVQLYRGGSSMTLALKGGQIGVNGRVVQPAGR